MHLRVPGALLLAGALAGCDGAGACVELPAECTPQYEPTFDAIAANTLAPTCGAGGSSCHAAAGAQGGLVLDDADVAYAALLGADGSLARVTPGDAACSPLVERLHAADAAELMPPGEPLSDGELCAIQQWIDAGAPR